MLGRTSPGELGLVVVDRVRDDGSRLSTGEAERATAVLPVVEHAFRNADGAPSITSRPWRDSNRSKAASTSSRQPFRFTPDSMQHRGGSTTSSWPTQKANGFDPAAVVREVLSMTSDIEQSTVETHITARMCINAPRNHGTVYADLSPRRPPRRLALGMHIDCVRAAGMQGSPARIPPPPQPRGPTSL